MRQVSPEKIERLLQQVNDSIREISLFKYDSENIDISKIPEIEYAVPINFDTEGSVSNLLKNGWSLPEKERIWSIGDYSDMIFRVPETNKDLILEVRGEPFIPTEADKQLVRVLINNRLIANWPCRDSGNYASLVFNHLIPKDGVVYLKFEYENPQSPKSLGKSNDARVLGFSFRSIQIREVS